MVCQLQHRCLQSTRLPDASTGQNHDPSDETVVVSLMHACLINFLQCRVRTHHRDAKTSKVFNHQSPPSCNDQNHCFNNKSRMNLLPTKLGGVRHWCFLLAYSVAFRFRRVHVAGMAEPSRSRCHNKNSSKKKTYRTRTGRKRDHWIGITIFNIHTTTTRKKLL